MRLPVSASIAALPLAPPVYVNDPGCAVGILGYAVPLLREYPPAQNYCKANYPVPTQFITTGAAIPTKTIMQQVKIVTTITSRLRPEYRRDIEGDDVEARQVDLSATLASITEEPTLAVESFCSCINQTPVKTVSHRLSPQPR